MNAITIEKKTPLGEKIMFAAAGRSKDESRAAIMAVCVHTKNGKSHIVGTDGSVCLYVEISEDDLQGIPAGVYQFDETKTRLVLEADTDGITYPNWEQVVPAHSGAPISDLIHLDKDASGKVNALIGTNNMLQPERTFFIRNELFVMIEKVAKGKEWSMWQPAHNDPIKLESGEFHAVIMPMQAPTSQCDVKRKE